MINSGDQTLSLNSFTALVQNLESSLYFFKHDWCNFKNHRQNIYYNSATKWYTFSLCFSHAKWIFPYAIPGIMI